MIIHGHCLRKIEELEPNSIQSVVTSPPYWALRDYDEAGDMNQDGILNVLDVVTLVNIVLNSI